jgi:hypothetical protein
MGDIISKSFFVSPETHWDITEYGILEQTPRVITTGNGVEHFVATQNVDPSWVEVWFHDYIEEGDNNDQS